MKNMFDFQQDGAPSEPLEMEVWGPYKWPKING